MTALLALLLVLSVCGGIPGAYLYGRRVGRHVQTSVAFRDGFSLGLSEGARQMRDVVWDAAMRRIGQEGP